MIMSSKILLIENEVQTRNIYRECLQTEGFETIEANNGLSGIHQAKQKQPDLVICDVVMPEMDGYEVLKTLRQDPDTAVIPFIFMTGKSTKSELRYGMELGADDYLTKPATVEELLKAIAIRLKRQRERQQQYKVKFQQASIDISISQDEQPTPLIFPQNNKLKEVFDFIEAHYHESIGLKDVAEAVGYSSAYLTDLVKRQTGQTVNRWIIKRRMAAAEVLLLESEKSIEQIAEAIGYLSPGHFFRQFRQHYQTTPNAWRNSPG